jgi:hypothetical protein
MRLISTRLCSSDALARRSASVLVLRSTEAQIRLMVQFESKKIGTLLQGKSNHCLC